MNIHKSQLFWGSLGARVLTNSHLGLQFAPKSLTFRMCKQKAFYSKEIVDNMYITDIYIYIYTE